MRTAGIVPAHWEFDADGLPSSADYGDFYHPQANPFGRARQVFLGGNGLPTRWQGLDRFVVLETGFGLGNNFLATWDAWRRDAQRCRQLHFISIERHPLTRADLDRMHRASPLRPLAHDLVDAWPPLTPNLHRLSFDSGQVQLLLALGDVAAWLTELDATVDAFYLDGFAPASNPAMWQARLFKAMARLAAPGATAATWTGDEEVRAGLKTAGFDVQVAAGDGSTQGFTLARFAPVFQPRRTADLRRAVPSSERPSALSPSTPSVQALGRIAIVGAGLAGCAAAWALAEQGRSCTLFDRHTMPAQEASGNPGGLFHGIVNPQDGAHARFNRAAALEAHRVVKHAILAHGVSGSAQGLLRLEPTVADAELMHAQLVRLGLPADYVQAVSAERACEICSLPLQRPAWFYPGGGWVDPGALARALLAGAGTKAVYRGGTEVQAIRHHAMGWELLDRSGGVIDTVQSLVLANALDAVRLLATAGLYGSPAWPVNKVRGQISLLRADNRLALPRVPLAGSGYLLPELHGRAVFGASSQVGDEDPSVRQSDHGHNLAQLARLIGRPLPSFRPESLQGRTGWRMVSSDRLPIVGAVPDTTYQSAPGARRLDQPRFVPRVPGMFVFVALGSRGITWSALGAQVLASSITGAPQPLESSLLDAIDPARFISKAVRRSSTGR